MPNAEEVKSNLKKELADLVRLRDELKVQLHLGAADARDEWHKLEGKLETLQSELDRFGAHAKVPLDDMKRGAEGLAKELRAGFQRIKSQIGK